VGNELEALVLLEVNASKVVVGLISKFPAKVKRGVEKRARARRERSRYIEST